MANPSRPIMFPCAKQVSVIQVGADELDQPSKSRQTKQYTIHQPQRGKPSKPRDSKTSVPKPVLETVSDGLTFTDEVVRELAPQSIPFNEHSIYSAYDTSEFLSKVETKMNLPGGRFNMHGPDRRHMSCNFKKTVPYRLKPIKREIMRRAMEMHNKALEEEKQLQLEDGSAKNNSDQTVSVNEPSFFLTESKQRKETKSSKGSTKTQSGDTKQPEKEKYLWDEYLLSILSKPTAQWIVTQRTNPADSRYKALHTYMVKKHGIPSSTELVRDNMAEYDDDESPAPVAQGRKVPNTRSARLLQRAHDVPTVEVVEEEEDLDTVPYADENKASFYRQPAGIKKAIKLKEKEHAGNESLERQLSGALNTTATSIVVKEQRLSPPPKLRDFVDPRITENTVFETENNFQRDWLTGTQQVYQPFGDKSEIVMENHNRYDKVVQCSYPRDTTEWHPEDLIKPDTASRIDSPTTVHKIDRGHQRWRGLPKPVEDAGAMIVGVIDEIEQSVNPSTDKYQPSAALSQIVDEWRSKWHLNMRFDDATPDELINDMSDIHPHVRIKAVSTCARAAAYKAPPVQGIQITVVDPQEKARLPENIFVALECLLNDEHEKVQLAAAITLHALNRPNQAAKDILRLNLQPDQNKADRWAAVQCLGFFGECDSDVIAEGVDQMMTTENMIRYEKACALLAHVSRATNLVHSMLAEQLNDCSWRRRVMALKCLPKLMGELNRDIQNKLIHLMWHDTHSDVRKSAAQSLGKCGYGRLVHDRMREILIEGTQSERTETLAKIGFLGIMTAKLMPPFIRAFRDEYVAVRREACIAAGNLSIQDDMLIQELLRLSTRDPIWRIKALAIQALGKIGVCTDTVRECILWALRFEEEDGVRAEACHSIILLQLKDKEVLDIIQNRMLVEDSPVVQEELAVALELNGVSASEDMEMVARIKAEVRKLSNRNDIYKSICYLEKQEDRQENIEKMIYIPTPGEKLKKPEPVDEEELVEQEEESDEIGVTPARSYPQGFGKSTLGSSGYEDTVKTEITEPIIEESDEEYPPSPKTAPRQSSAKSRLTSASRKSRPPSGASSFYTDIVEKELEEVMSEEVDITGEDDERDESSTSSATTDRTTGYSKRRSRSCKTSVTPTVLSISLDQTELIHHPSPSVLENMKDEEDQILSMSPSAQTEIQRASGHILHKGSAMSRQGSQVSKPESFQSEKLPAANEFIEKPSSFDPVDLSRFQSTNFLFNRYSNVDIATPDTLSPVSSNADLLSKQESRT